MKKQMAFGKINGSLEAYMGDMIFCDSVYLDVVPTSCLPEAIRVAPGRRFMTTEFFWEALL